MDGHQLRAVVESRFDLDFMHHLGNAFHHFALLEQGRSQRHRRLAKRRRIPILRPAAAELPPEDASP